MASSNEGKGRQYLAKVNVVSSNLIARSILYTWSEHVNGLKVCAPLANLIRHSRVDPKTRQPTHCATRWIG
ncbi:MAG: hypothetical protein DHS20C06_00370 [Hyphobacterium sp.]|nr:MAG: hypothetical protein DHS20C06_00370 [Hyphobacterium sp.]